MNPQTLNSLIQLGSFALDAIDRYSKGDMTDEEVAQEWADLQTRLGTANDMWERAGQSNP